MLTPIGQTLKAAREQRGLSLLDVAYQTRIPVSRLTMLEQDNFAALGGMTYARSFLRHYSQYLEVDASAILEDLPSGVLGGPRDYRYLLENHGDWVPPKNARRGSSSRPHLKGRVRRSPVPAGLFIFVLVLIGTGMWGKYVADDRLAAEEAAKLAAPMPAPVSPMKPLSASVQVPQVKTDPQPPVKILKAIPVSENELGQGSAGNSSRVE
ncbi:MAG: helix-turn-helix domain-containing protein [Verrucomicrobiota bacterium]